MSLSSVERHLAPHLLQVVAVAVLLVLDLPRVVQLRQLGSPLLVHLLLDLSPVPSVSLSNLPQHVSLVLLPHGSLSGQLLLNVGNPIEIGSPRERITRRRETIAAMIVRQDKEDVRGIRFLMLCT